jgi:hypothetical protein
MSKRRNPVYLDPQPSLFAGEPDFSHRIEWKNATASQLMSAAESEYLTEDEIDEIDKILDLIEEEGVEAAIAAGVNPVLARDLTGAMYEEIVDLGVSTQKRRVEPLLLAILDRAEGTRESHREQVGEWALDHFIGIMSSDGGRLWVRNVVDTVVKEDSRYGEYANNDTIGVDELLSEIVEDPGLYSIEVSDDPYHGSRGVVFSTSREKNEFFEFDFTNGFMDELEHLRSDSDLKYLLDRLDDKDVYVGRRPSLYDLQSDRWPSLNFSIHVGLYVFIYPDLDAIYEVFLERLNESGYEEGAASEEAENNVVYRFCGTNECIGGASARNMYVASLTPKQLRKEGTELGICVGRPDMPYGKNLRNGIIEIYSIRTESGRSKFTIERSVSGGDIRQVKGKANRLPGYEPGKYDLTKPDEVRLVVEFLTSLGMSPSEIRGSRDISPGVQAMIDAGQDPFSPPKSRRQLQEVRANSERARRMAMAAYNQPWGGVWGE